jgi:hypothetical protein
MTGERIPLTRSPRVAVVGPCASGKSTLVEGLRAHGFDAYVCAQEHSEIPTLWRHLEPDVVIALDVDLATVRRRRGEDWPETIYRQQIRRLAPARSVAELIVNTAESDEVETLRRALAVLARHADLSDG